jgi:hypothetical protein
MTVLPKPVPGCVRVAGVAGQQGITWPTFYNQSISSPLWRLGPSPLERGPGAGRIDRTYIGFLELARRARTAGQIALENPHRQMLDG